MNLLATFCFILTISLTCDAYCTRGCYEWCPNDFCFLTGNRSNPSAIAVTNILDAISYCSSLGCNLPAFWNATEFADFTNYHTCSNNTVNIASNFVWLDYVTTTQTTNNVGSPGSWHVASSNPRLGSSFRPNFAPGQPEGYQYYSCEYQGLMYDIQQIYPSPVNIVCMCLACPSTMCSMTNGYANPVLGHSQFPFGLGSHVAFTCNYGYFLIGGTSSYCEQNSSTLELYWTRAKPNCTEVLCPNIFPSNSTGGYMSSSVFTAVQANYTYNCYANYFHWAQNTTTPLYICIQLNSTASSGTWLPANFTDCTITCPNLTNPFNGTVVYPFDANPLSLPPANTNANYTCNVGFNLVGISITTCLSNGNWSSDPPICQPNCSLSAWTDWSTCTKSCDGGMQIRTRNITQPGLCFPLNDTQICGTDKCIVKVVIVVIQNIGCSILLILIAATFLLNLLLRVRHLERLIHACEEITLFIAHIFILAFRNSVENNVLCTTAAAVIQFCMLSCFTFFLLEAIQLYAYVTSVTAKGNFPSVWLNMIVGFGVPAAITGPLLGMYPNEYPSAISCWLNWGSRIALGSVAPIMVMSGTVVIILEAAGMGVFVPLIGRNNVKYSANWFNRHGLIFVLSACIAHWYIGFTAIYYGNVALYTAVFITFTVLGVMIFIHHSLCHHVVHVWLYKQYRKMCCKKGPMPNWVSNPEDVKHKKGFEGLRNFFQLNKKPETTLIETQNLDSPIEQVAISVPETSIKSKFKHVAKSLAWKPINEPERPINHMGVETWLNTNELFPGHSFPLPVNKPVHNCTATPIGPIAHPFGVEVNNVDRSPSCTSANNSSTVGKEMWFSGNEIVEKLK